MRKTGRKPPSRGRHHARRGPPRRAAATGIVLAALLFEAAPPAAGAGAEPQVQTTQAEEGAGWFERQLRKFRGYPRLDRAYRLVEQDRHAEARAQFEAYLSIEPRDAKARLEYAALLLRLSDYGAAVSAANEVLRLRPGNPSALLARAQALRELGRDEEAVADFKAVMRNDAAPAADRVFAARSMVQLTMARQRPDEALVALDYEMQFAREAETDFAFQMRRATALQALGLLTEAQAGFQRALEHATSREERLAVLPILAHLAAERGDLDARRSSYRAALELDPRNTELMRALADTEAAATRYAAAAEWLRQALAIAPSDDNRRFLADLLVRQNDHRGAEAQYTALLAGERSTGERFRLLMSRGYARHTLGDYVEASADFRAALTLRRDPAAITALANALEATGDRIGMVEALQTLVQEHPSAAHHQRLGDLLETLGDEAGAARHLEAATRKRGTRELHRRLGFLYVRRGDLSQALHHFEEAARRGGNEDHYSVGVLHAALNNDEAAQRAFERAVAGTAATEWRADAWRQLAGIYGRRGRDEQAATALRRALEAGATDWQTRRQLAFTLTRLERHAEALEEFRAVAATQPGPESELQVGFSLLALRRPDEAMQHLQAARAGAAQLDEGARKQLFDELGELHIARGEREAAVEAWGRSLAISPDAATALRRASLLREAGDLAQAESTLQVAAGGSLPVELQARWWEELSQLFTAKNESELAAGALETADQFAPSAERRYRIGVALQNAGRAHEALGHFEAARERDPNAPLYAVSLAYGYANAGRHDDAAAMFRAALEREPERLDLQQNLAYTYLRADRREDAVGAFKRAIDLRHEQLAAAPVTGISGDAELYRMRREVADLERRHEFSLYHSYRPDSDRQRTANAGGGVIPSQGGAEYAYRLSTPGSRAALDIFSRLMWSPEPGRSSPDKDSVQGGVGVRLKPFARHDFFVSGERLFEVGSDARNDWLVRASYGWTNGYAPRRDESSWNYTTLYADIGYFTRDGGTTAYFLEARQGWTFKVGEQLLVTPHVTASRRHLEPDEFDGAFREAGAGVSLRYLFNESHYATARSSAELLVQYKKGIGADRDVDGTWVLTGVLRF